MAIPHRKLVYLLDDMPILSKLYSEVLERHGYTTAIVSSSDEALADLTKRPKKPACIVLDVNVSAEGLAAVIAVLPSMQQPTISPLHGGGGFAVRAAVPRQDLPRLIPLLRARGARDLVVTAVAQLVP